jgi:hypothetical protein
MLFNKISFVSHGLSLASELVHVGWRGFIAPNHHGAVQALLGFGEAQAKAGAEFASVADVLAVKRWAGVAVSKVLCQVSAARLHSLAIHWVGVALGDCHEASKANGNQ